MFRVNTLQRFISEARGKTLKKRWLWEIHKVSQTISTSSNESGTSGKKKYSDTILLPKTSFPMKIPYAKRTEHEKMIADKHGFEELYGLQRLWNQDKPEFILHDGPPYANGRVHVGHAVNKILKDITNRYMLLKGHKVNFTLGYDCHGLPIELKALKNLKSTENIQDVRNAARKVAEESIKDQLNSFKRWGIMAEWNNFYKTYDKSYIVSQLQCFLELYEKGLVFRSLKPIYWSPASGSALAESELEYRENHESPSLYLGLDLTSDLDTFLAHIKDEEYYDISNGPLKAVIWTTTPWTIPSNEAVAYKDDEMYSILFQDGYSPSYYIVASDLESKFYESIGKKFHKVTQFSGHLLQGMKYKHPWFKDKICPLISSDHVSTEKGTGLVHTAPAHGHDDFVLGLKHHLPMNCYVNDKGCFTEEIPELHKQSVLSLGNKTILDKLKNDVIYSSKIIHSYPYDWRSKQPVIIKASQQWFIDTDKLKEKALESLNSVGIYPKNVRNAMISPLLSRPYWCISRQRVWGVPIPVVYRKDTGEPLVDKEIIERICKKVEINKSIDFWWSSPIESFFEDKEEAKLYEKGKDIFDIWLDSGLSWHILGGKQADIYLEGRDQFQGWFQSSLLTSIALRDLAPYKNLFVHGFVVDEMGRKMSKSVGNVIDPNIVVDGSSSGGKSKLPAFGADVLRWWVATQGSADDTNIPISSTFLRMADDNVQKLRNVLKFLISFCNENSATELHLNSITYDELMYTDQYMLAKLKGFEREVDACYESLNYHKVLMKTLHFAATDVSSNYFAWIKDRLYCDAEKSASRKSCIYVMNQIYLTLSKVLAPTLPFLVEESYSHYQLRNQSIFKSTWFDSKDTSWDNDQMEEIFDVVLDIKTSLNHLIGSSNPKNIWVEIHCSPKVFDDIQLLHPAIDVDDHDKCNSELCDILQVSGVDVHLLDTGDEDEDKDLTEVAKANVKFEIKPFGVSHSLVGYSLGAGYTEMMVCARCRRHCCLEGEVLCSRCMSVIKSLLQRQSCHSSVNSSSGLHSSNGKKIIAASGGIVIPSAKN